MALPPIRPFNPLRTGSSGLRRIAVAVPLVVIVGYVVFWFTAARTAETQVARWIEAQAEQGVTVTHGEVTTGGFPFRVSLRLGTPAAHWSSGDWQGPDLTLAAAPWAWRRISWSAPGVHTLTWKHGAQRETATLTAGHLEGWGEAGDKGIASWEAWLTDGHLTTPRGPFTARGLLVQFQPPAPDGGGGAVAGTPESATDATPRLPVTVDAKGVTLPPRMNTALGDTIDRLALEVSVNGPVEPAGPWPAPALAWRDAGGVLEIKSLGISMGPLNLSGDGAVAIDGAGQPEGAFTARVTGYAETVEALRKAGVVDDGAAQAVQVVLGLLSKGPPGGPRSLDVPITVQDRRLSLGRVELFRLKSVDWFRPPLR